MIDHRWNRWPVFPTVLLVAIILFAMAPGCHNDMAPGRLLRADSASSGSSTNDLDPLPSWADGITRQSIMGYIKKVTDSGGSGFIPVADRIATFDNDGTLWAEKPYVQELFAFYRVKKMVEANPSLAQKQPFKAVLENDKGYFIKGGEKALIQLVAATHTGMTEDQFEMSVADFAAQARVGGRTLHQIVYQPQLELLDYLRANEFKIYICTGGTIEMVRGISMSLYGIPGEQVIGTSFRYRFIDSNRALLREPALDHLNDKEGKPVGIQLHIGKRPVFACGNEGGAGDIAMLKYCQGNHHLSFQLLINHDDSAREFFYQEKDNASLLAAAANDWHVVSMKNDWKTIYVTNEK